MDDVRREELQELSKTGRKPESFPRRQSTKFRRTLLVANKRQQLAFLITIARCRLANCLPGPIGKHPLRRQDDPTVILIANGCEFTDGDTERRERTNEGRPVIVVRNFTRWVRPPPVIKQTLKKPVEMLMIRQQTYSPARSASFRLANSTALACRSVPEALVWSGETQRYGNVRFRRNPVAEGRQWPLQANRDQPRHA